MSIDRPSCPDPLISEAMLFARGYLGASAALFYWVDPRQKVMQVCETQCVPAGLLEEYAQCMGSYDPMGVKRMVDSGEKVGVLSSAQQRVPAREASYYKGYLSAFGVRDTIDLMLWANGCAYGGMGLLKTAADPDTPVDTEPLRRLQSFLEVSFIRHPHISQFQIDAKLSRRGLSHREKQVTRLLCEGASNREIAEHMGVTVATVKTYLVRIFEKTDVKSRTALAAYIGQQ